MFVRVGGIPGVGKTAVIERAVELSRETGIDLERARTKEVLCELASVETVEEYRRLPLKLRKSLYPPLDRRLYAEDRLRPCVMKLYDSHFYFFDPETGNYQTRTLLPEDKQQLRAIVVLAVDNVKVVSKRRQQDQSFRLDRQQLSIGLLHMEQAMEIKVASSQAAQLEIPFQVLYNEDGDLDRVALQLLTFVERQRRGGGR